MVAVKTSPLLVPVEILSGYSFIAGTWLTRQI